MSSKTIHKARTLMEKLNSLSVVDKNKEYELIHTLMSCYGSKPDQNVSELVFLLERVLYSHEVLESKNDELEEMNNRLKEKLAQNEQQQQQHTPRERILSPRTFNQMPRYERDQFILMQVQRDVVPPSPFSSSPFPSPRENAHSSSPFSSPYSSPREPFSPRSSPFGSPRERSFEDVGIVRRHSSCQHLSSSKILSVNSRVTSVPFFDNQQRITPNNATTPPPGNSPVRSSSNPGGRTTSSKVVTDLLNNFNITRNRGVSEPVAYTPSPQVQSKPRHKKGSFVFKQSQLWEPR
jgi:hypothetical protein